MNRQDIEKKAMEIVNAKPFTSLTHPISKQWAYDSAIEMAEWVQEQMKDNHQKPIDEDNLYKIADSVNPNSSHGDSYQVGQYHGFQEGFIVGYLKANWE